MRLAWGLVGVASVVALVGCGTSTPDTSGLGSSKEISKATWTGDWPLTVDSAILGCTSPDPIDGVTLNVNGTMYAVNGTALGVQDFDARGWHKIDEIWADSTNFPDQDGPKVSLSPLIDEGLKLCPDGGK